MGFGGREREGEVVLVVVVGCVDFGDLPGETIGKREAAEGESGMTAAAAAAAAAAVAAAVVLGLVVVGDCGLTGAGAV